MYFYAEHIIGAIAADITVVTPEGDVYSGKFDRQKADFSNDLKDQAIWQIIKTRVASDNGTSTYETLYPEGSKAFGFVWSDHASLSYTYGKN